MLEPKIRFRRDDGSLYPSWNQTQVGDIYRKAIEKNDLSFGPDKIISVANMFFKGSDDRDSLDDDYMKTYNVMRIGDIAFEGHANKEHQYGRFVANTIGDGIVSHIFLVLRPKSEQHNHAYWKYVINNEKVIGPILRLSTKKSTMMHDLVLVDFLKLKIAVPCSEEQDKIAEFLSSVDEVIATSEQEVANLETQKKAVMKKIFIQEVRFKKDDGTDFPEWKDGCFGDLIEIYDERVTADCTLPVLTSSKQYGIQYQRDHFAKEQQHDITGYGVLPRGYCTYRNRSDGTDFTFNINNLCDKGIVSKFYPVFKATDRCVLYFLMILLNNEPSTVKKISVTAKGTGQKVLSFLDLQKISIPIPCLEEQRLIADFLSDFDEAIAAAKKELQLWKELKKGLLQQMFV